jgi:hypothetical protein
MAARVKQERNLSPPIPGPVKNMQVATAQGFSSVSVATAVSILTGLSKNSQLMTESALVIELVSQQVLIVSSDKNQQPTSKRGSWNMKT